VLSEFFQEGRPNSSQNRIETTLSQSGVLLELGRPHPGKSKTKNWVRNNPLLGRELRQPGANLSQSDRLESSQLENKKLPRGTNAVTSRALLCGVQQLGTQVHLQSHAQGEKTAVGYKCLTQVGLHWQTWAKVSFERYHQCRQRSHDIRRWGHSNIYRRRAITAHSKLEVDEHTDISQRHLT